ncbi:MAG: hypothetical protein WBO37_11305, partial [Gammaproteobacteria bacterium]
PPPATGRWMSSTPFSPAGSKPVPVADYPVTILDSVAQGKLNMAIIHPTPKEIEVRQMLTMLYGSKLTVSTGEALATDADCGYAAAVFVSDDGTPVTACVCDMQFAAFAGAALTRIPRGAAEDAVKSGKLSENMQGNLKEVMNICSRLFMDDNSPHLKLDNLYESIGVLPDSARSLMDSVQGRLDLIISIPDYGDGKLSFLST